MTVPEEKMAEEERLDELVDNLAYFKGFITEEELEDEEDE